MTPIPSSPAEAWRKQHPFLPASWAPNLPDTPRVPDVNPADRVTERMRQNETARIPLEQPDLMKEIDALRGELRYILENASGAIEHPFQIQQVDDDTINVRYGTVQDIAPTDVATNINVTGTATHYVHLNCTLNVAGEITAAEVDVNTTGVPADDNDSAYILLGTVVTSSSVITAINQAVTHSLRFRTCDRTDDGGSPAAVVNAGTYHFWGV